MASVAPEHPKPTTSSSTHFVITARQLTVAVGEGVKVVVPRELSPWFWAVMGQTVVETATVTMVVRVEKTKQLLLGAVQLAMVDVTVEKTVDVVDC